MSGLSDYRYEGLIGLMIVHSTTIYTEMAKLVLGEEDLSEEMKFLIQYNVAGSVYMVKHWLTSHNHVSHREFAKFK